MKKSGQNLMNEREKYKTDPVYELEKFKKKWKKIFYVEGVFDLFHEWHKAFLEYIRKKIDHFYWEDFILVVAVESDRKTKDKKWKSRPKDFEAIRCKNVEKTWLADIVYINNNDVRYLIDDLKRLKVDYLVFPEEYIKHLKLFFLIKRKLKKHWIKIVLSRHKQYNRYWISKNLSLIHTTSILNDSFFWKLGVKVRHITYLARECLFLLLKN